MLSSENNIRDKILEDAIMTAINGEIKNTKLKIAAGVTSAIAIVEFIALIILVFR